jgi:hypothetical protein
VLAYTGTFVLVGNYIRGYSLGCLDRGLHCKNLNNEKYSPFKGPYIFIALFEYSEQVGSNLHPPLKMFCRMEDKKVL